MDLNQILDFYKKKEIICQTLLQESKEKRGMPKKKKIRRAMPKSGISYQTNGNLKSTLVHIRRQRFGGKIM